MISKFKWYDRPISIEYHPKNLDCTIFIDENGHNNLKHCMNAINNGNSVDIGERYFTLTGCIILKEDLKNIKHDINLIKNKYWDNGTFKYKDEIRRVCFHSRDIRKEKPPFYFREQSKQKSFYTDINNFIENTNMQIISANIDKYKLCFNYYNPFCPYELGIIFILERYYYFLKENNFKGNIILEGRGKNEDFALLQKFKDILLINGTRYINSEEFSNYITGVYFNSKWNENKLTYFGLEIADLCSYPIHKYFRNNKKPNINFNILKNKIRNYPNFDGSGIKFFP